MKRLLFYCCSLAVLLAGCPLIGVLYTGKPLSLYLEFPPRRIYVHHAPFSWPVFFFIAGFVVLCVFPFIKRGMQLSRVSRIDRPDPANTDTSSGFFPWWGYAGIVCVAAAWLFSWTRFSWFSLFQHYTYPPLWFGYIVIINALTYKRSGGCMLTHNPLFFVVLFPVSTVFWWFFEYLNRFVQNWYYLAVSDFDPFEYALYASVCFSTVIPAVLSTRDYLLTFNGFKKAFGSWNAAPRLRSPLVGWIVCIAAALGLTGIGMYPNVLFPLLWLAPLLVVVGMQKIASRKHIFSPLVEGDWTGVVSAACAALICGFFWEMWNYYSLAKWVYMVPYVEKFHLFEMPALGYAGYLPFGLECAVIGDLLSSRPRRNVF